MIKTEEVNRGDVIITYDNASYCGTSTSEAGHKN